MARGSGKKLNRLFQHTAARRRLPILQKKIACFQLFQHTAARRRLPGDCSSSSKSSISFQHTAARRRLHGLITLDCEQGSVSTHSRAEAAATQRNLISYSDYVSTHSRAEAAAIHSRYARSVAVVSTHSRAEAAALVQINLTRCFYRFNTQPRGGGC